MAKITFVFEDNLQDGGCDIVSNPTPHELAERAASPESLTTAVSYALEVWNTLIRLSKSSQGFAQCMARTALTSHVAMGGGSGGLH